MNDGIAVPSRPEIFIVHGTKVARNKNYTTGYNFVLLALLTHLDVGLSTGEWFPKMMVEPFVNAVECSCDVVSFLAQVI